MDYASVCPPPPTFKKKIQNKKRTILNASGFYSELHAVKRMHGLSVVASITHATMRWVRSRELRKCFRIIYYRK